MFSTVILAITLKSNSALFLKDKNAETEMDFNQFKQTYFFLFFEINKSQLLAHLIQGHYHLWSCLAVLSITDLLVNLFSLSQVSPIISSLA